MNKSGSGFTIVELLIVIVVIAILAAISIVVYSGIRTRAQATAIATDLKATEKALRAYRTVSGQDAWWIDNSPSLTGAANPFIYSIMASQPDFRNFLQKAPSTEGLDTSYQWYYDNDGDTYNGCSTSSAGVNITVRNAQNTTLMQTLDTIIDDGDLSCGAMRVISGDIYYHLSP